MENAIFSVPPPTARAALRGDAAHPDLAGEVLFSPYGRGSLVLVRAVGLPVPGFLGLHIHAVGVCDRDGDVPFSTAGGHYDPHGVPHPWHSGDLPSLLVSADGVGLMAVYTDRFRPREVVGRSVILHQMADDFHSQPSGDSGARLACGVIGAL